LTDRRLGPSSDKGGDDERFAFRNGPGCDRDHAGLGPNYAKSTATFINAQAQQIGTANLLQTSQGVLIEAEVQGLPPGEHASHIH